MNQYLLLIQANAKAGASDADWERFLAAARESGGFRGGSALGRRMLLGNAESAKSSEHIAGYMRFDSDDKEALLALLCHHPVVLHGGSVELSEMPKS